MKSAKLTLEAIDRYLETNQESSFRAHLGASVIGKKCDREIFYSWRWAKAEAFSGQQLRLFGRGHKEEPRFLEYLLNIGCQIWPIDPRTGKQWRWSDHNGHMGGSADGFGVGIPDLPPGTPFSISCKTHNDNSFKQLLERGVMGSKFEHFVQEQYYLHKARADAPIEWCLYMAVNKNTDHIHLELIHYDRQVAERLIERGGNIIYTNEPPARIANSPGAYACKFCHYQRLCHFGDELVARNCRTCRFSRPAANGLWHCGLHDSALGEASQREGCGSYQTHSKLSGLQP